MQTGDLEQTFLNTRKKNVKATRRKTKRDEGSHKKYHPVFYPQMTHIKLHESLQLTRFRKTRLILPVLIKRKMPLLYTGLGADGRQVHGKVRILCFRPVNKYHRYAAGETSWPVKSHLLPGVRPALASARSRHIRNSRRGQYVTRRLHLRQQHTTRFMRTFNSTHIVLKTPDLN